MSKQKNIQISIPEGYFEGDCYSCFHMKSKSTHDNGSIFCKECSRTVFPSDNYDCPRYLWKVKGWLIAGGLIYFIITVGVIVIEHLML